MSERTAAETNLEAGVSEILIEAETLQGRIRELGEEISADYDGRDLLLVGVLKGAVFFMADLMRELTVPCEIDFMAISSYGAQTDSSGVVRILKDLDINISGRDVVVVEDIIDSGLTLSYLMRSLKARKPATVEICALLTKPERRVDLLPIRREEQLLHVPRFDPLDQLRVGDLLLAVALRNQRLARQPDEEDDDDQWKERAAKESIHKGSGRRVAA